MEPLQLSAPLGKFTNTITDAAIGLGMKEDTKKKMIKNNIKIREDTHHTLRAYCKRGRPRKIAADAPIEDLVNLYTKKEGVIDDKPSKEDVKKVKIHKAKMKKLLGDLGKHQLNLKKIMDKHKGTLEGAGYKGGNIFDWLANISPSIVKYIPIVGPLMSSAGEALLDVLDPYRKNPRHPQPPTPVIPPAGPKVRQIGEESKITDVKPVDAVQGVRVSKGAGRIRKRLL